MLYSRFASSLYRRGMGKGFQLMGADASSPSEATYFHLQKIEGASTFLYVTVIDTARADWSRILENDANIRAQASNLLDRVRNVALVYLLVEPTAAIDTAALPAALVAPYEGQSIYSVLWRAALDSGEISTISGQPQELFGLRALVNGAFEDANAPPPAFDAVEAARELLNSSGGSVPSNVVPIRRTPLNKTAQRTRRPDLMTRLRHMHIQHYPRYDHAYICYAIMAANLVIFLLMTFSGSPHMAHAGYRFGGIFAPAVLEWHEWWRLFTAMFVHFDIIHLLANSFGIIVFGTRVERYFGRVTFIILYVGTGLTGSLFSLLNLHLSRSNAVSGGASGAVYGLIAAIFIITRITRSYIETLHHRVMLMFIAIGLIMGFAMQGIDNAGHIGGMVGGVILGFGVLVHMARKR